MAERGRPLGSQAPAASAAPYDPAAASNMGYHSQTAHGPDNDLDDGAPAAVHVAQYGSSMPSWLGGGGYAPVAPPPSSAAAGTVQRTPSTLARLSGLAHRFSLRRRQHPPEGGDIAMSLMGAPAPVGGHQEAWEALHPPPPPRDELFLKTSQEQEAKGTLTGGLGVGFDRVDATMGSRDLLGGGEGGGAMSTTLGGQHHHQQQHQHASSHHHHWASSLSRSFTRRAPLPTRRDTIRGLGQNEANRRGQVIEVVVEDDDDDDGRSTLGPIHPSTMDVTFMTGPATLETAAPRKRTRTEVFYPKGNWKPFPMRAPYLVMLIILSLVLALAQEILYERFNTRAMFRFRTPSELGSANYFAVKFLPTIISVIYGVLWQVTDFEVMRLEAFHQLSKHGGALAGQSINVGYVTQWSLLRPFRALKLGHYAVCVSSVATALAVSLVPTFSAASIYLSPDRATRMADPDLVKSIHVRDVWSRLLTATLLLCAVFGCMLLFLLQFRKSGLLADVRGIAGLASMAVASHILNDFRDLDTAKPRDIHDRLKHHRYVLRNASLAPDDGSDPPSVRDQARFRPHHSENPHPLMLRPLGCVPFIVGLALFTGFVPIFLFTPATIITDKAPYVITALAVCIKLTWGAMETAVRLMEPYYVLSRRHAPPRTLTLDYAAMPFGYLAFQAFYNGHILMFLVGFGTVMAEFLTILVTSLSTVDGRDFLKPVFGIDIGGGSGRDDGGGDDDDDGIKSGQETAVSFLVALSLVLFILVYMFIMTTIVFARRRHVYLPRQPTTIASVLAFIHQSKMLWDFVDTSRLSNAAMVRHLEGKGKTYGLGWYRGRDGQMHCGIDEEELLAAYKDGLDYSQGRAAWAGGKK